MRRWQREVLILQTKSGGRGNKQSVRLEVGTAHRCYVDETNRVNNQRVILCVNGFINEVPVGGAHL